MLLIKKLRIMEYMVKMEFDFREREREREAMMYKKGGGF
jgi:hypothetical protein